MRDWQLLRQYVDEGSNRAFDEIVERYGKLVYSASLREVRDPEMARDVFQNVFVILACKARRLRRGTILSGWLYQTARLASREAIRQEARRAEREKKAAINNTQSLKEEAVWEKVDPMVHEAMSSLSDFDRNLILLRFFQEMSLREAGDELGLSENAARMRVSRSLEKMRRFLEKHGAALTVATLATLLAERAVHADLPEGLAQDVTQIASNSVAGASSIPLTPIAKGVLTTMLHAQIRRAFVAASVVAAIVGASAVASHIVTAQQKPVVHPDDIGPIALVRQYLSVRAATNLDAQYKILSSASRKQMPESTYDQWKIFSQGAPTEVPLPVIAFIADGKNESKANYQIVGPEQANPEVVDVTAALPGAKSMTIKVVTLWDDADHARRIDILQTFETTSPDLAHAAKAKALATASMSNMKQLGFAIIQYASQTGRFPDADKWMDEILPYAKEPKLFKDPADPNQRPYGYAYNSALSGLPYNQVKNPPRTVLLFQSTLGTKNGASLGSSLPDPGPINGRTGIAFVDGHVTIVEDTARYSLIWQP